MEKKDALHNFFEAVQRLKDQNIIRSDKYLGDIAEFICKEKLGLELAQDLRQVGFDGILNGKKYQVKSNFGATKNVTFAKNVGQLNLFDAAFVVIGYQSCLARGFQDGEFRIYEFSKKEIIHHQNENGSYSCGIKAFLNKKPIGTYQI